jgi:regulator of sigma D
MQKSELVTILQSVQTRRDQYYTRLNTLARLYHTIEADAALRDHDPVCQQELVDEASTVHFDSIRHLHLYNPIIQHLKTRLASDTTESSAYYTLLTEHYESLMGFTETHLTELEEYIELLREAYSLHREYLQE